MEDFKAFDPTALTDEQLHRNLKAPAGDIAVLPPGSSGSSTVSQVLAQANQNVHQISELSAQRVLSAHLVATPQKTPSICYSSGFFDPSASTPPKTLAPATISQKMIPHFDVGDKEDPGDSAFPAARQAEEVHGPEADGRLVVVHDLPPHERHERMAPMSSQ